MRRRVELDDVWTFLSSLAGVEPSRKRAIQRGEERFGVESLPSSLGDVLDLSGCGARVRCRGRAAAAVGQVVGLKLRSDQFELTLKSRVVWVKRVGVRGCEMGFVFLQVRPALKEALRNLALYGFVPHAEAHAARSERATKTHARPDFYAVLRIREDATIEEIKTAHRDAAHRYHPDARQSPERVMMFEAVTEAYRVLRDPASRTQYDARRAAAKKKAEAA